MNISRVMKDHRKQNGLSIREAAKRIGVAHQTLFRFEKGGNLNSKQWCKLMTWLFK